MKTRKIPMRTCAVTKEKCEKRDLLRIVRNKELGVKVDETGKLNGRGVYIKKDLEVLKKARKNKILDKRLEVVVPEEVYEEIEKILTEKI